MLGALFFNSCGTSSNDDDSSSFDRNSLLINYCDNIIIPAYQDFNTQTIMLHDIVTSYSTGSSSLEDCRNQLFGTWISFQRIMPYNFGPAYNNLLNISANTYPTDVSQIELDIATGSWVPPTS